MGARGSVGRLVMTHRAFRGILIAVGMGLIMWALVVMVAMFAVGGV